jgi:uncharacterized phage protein (TIGR02216 family)
MTPWGEMLRTAVRLGVGPEGFWRLSLREWRMLTERPYGGVPMGRTDFERMAEAWPDGGPVAEPSPPGRCATTLPRRGWERS